MHARILHHLFMVLSGDVIRGPLWLGAQAAAFPNNTAYVHAQVSSLLTTSFPNMRAPQIEARPSSLTFYRLWCSLDIRADIRAAMRAWEGCSLVPSTAAGDAAPRCRVLSEGWRGVAAPRPLQGVVLIRHCSAHPSARPYP